MKQTYVFLRKNFSATMHFERYEMSCSLSSILSCWSMGTIHTFLWPQNNTGLWKHRFWFDDNENRGLVWPEARGEFENDEDS
jgi:hypothetical protein